MFISDRYNVLTLEKLLGGFKDVSLKIIKEKQQLELEDRKQEVIEQDFYNWLNYDLPARSFLGVLLKEYHSLTGHQQVEFLVDNIENKTYNHILVTEYFSYYNDFKKQLGLNGYYERTDNMNSLFEKKWWKTTEKNSLPWEKIHRTIKCKIEVKIYKKEFRYFHSQEQVEELYEEIPELFREPTFQEKYQVYDYVYHWKPRPSIVFVDCHLELVI